MTSSAAAHGARGAGVTLLAQAANTVLQFVGTIVMARVLTPDDYGLLAIVMVLMGIGALIRDFGMGTASLQEHSLNQAQASNLFWANALLSGGTAIVLAISAPLVALVFGDARLVGLVPVMAIVLLLTGLQTQYQVRIARQRRFTALAVAAVTSTGAGLAVGVITALAGWGYWALAAQQVAATLWMLVFYLLATRWLPSLPSRGVGSREHLRAGTHYGSANVLGYVADNIDKIMIGLRFGPTALGNYDRAFQLFMQPITSVFVPLTQVVIPTLNRAEIEGQDTNAMLLRVQSVLVGLATCALLVAAVTAEWLVPLLIGDQWDGIVPLLQILAIGGVFKALSQINYWAYISAKQPRELLLSNLVTKPLQIALVIVGAFFGVEWVAWAFVVGRAISWPINLAWLARTANRRSWDALWNGLRIIGSAAVAYLLTWVLLGMLPTLSDVSLILIGAAFSTGVFVLGFAIAPGGFRELRAVLSLRSVLSGFWRGTR